MSALLKCEPYHSSCVELWISKIGPMFKSNLKTYSIIHALTTFIFKRKEFGRDIKNEVKKLIIKILRSVLFMTSTILLLRITTCLAVNIFKRYNIYLALTQALIGAAGAVFETSSRVQDYTLFSLPKTIDSISDLLYKLGFNINIPYKMQLIFSFMIAMAVYLKSKGSLKQNLSRFLGYLMD